MVRLIDKSYISANIYKRSEYTNQWNKVAANISRSTVLNRQFTYDGNYISGIDGPEYPQINDLTINVKGVKQNC